MKRPTTRVLIVDDEQLSLRELGDHIHGLLES